MSFGNFSCGIKAAPSVLSNKSANCAFLSPLLIAQSTLRFSSRRRSRCRSESVLNAAARVFITMYAQPRLWKEVMSSMSSPCCTP